MKWLHARLILAIGWGVFFVHAYPGRMTRDSFDQLRQARAGVFLDDQPPMMQAIISLTDPLIAGPIGIVSVQSVMFLAGTYLVLRRAVSERVAALVAVAILLSPPVLAVLVVMWQEPLMAGALMLAAALLLSPRKQVRLWGLALVVVATGVRANALAATLGIVVALFEWNPLPRLQRYALAFGVWVAITAAAVGFNQLIADRETHSFATAVVDRIDRFRIAIGLTRTGETTWDKAVIVTHDDQDKATIWTFGVSTTTSPLQAEIDRALEDLSHTWLFRPYVYLFWTLVLLVLARRNAVAMALLLSGLGIELSLFFLAHAPTYRDSHWMICTTILAGILVFAERLRGNPRRP